MYLSSFFLLLSLVCTTIAASEHHESKRLKIAFGFDRPPYVFGKTTKKGFEIDLVDEILGRFGYDIDIEQMSKYYLETLLHKPNDFDGVSAISKQNDGLYYTEPFVYYDNYVITRTEDNITIESVEDLAKIDFVAWKGAYNDLGETFYRLFNPETGTARSRYHDHPSQAEDSQSFFAKKYDAIIVDKTIFKWHQMLYGDHGGYVYHKIFPRLKSYPAVFRSKKVRDDFNKGLAAIKKSGRYDEIVDFYFKQDIRPLLHFTEFIADLAGEMIYTLEPQKLHDILLHFFTHPDIMEITVRDNSLETDIVHLARISGRVVDVNGTGRYPRLPRMVNDTYYRGNKDPYLNGKVTIRYKKGYRNGHGVLIPPLSQFSDLSNDTFTALSNAYDRYSFIKRSEGLLSYEEALYLQNKRQINICVDPNWKPMEYVTADGKYEGILADFAQLISSKLHIPFVLQRTRDYAQSLAYVKRGLCDLIVGDQPEGVKKKGLLATQPYYNAPRIFVTHTDVPIVHDLSQLVPMGKIGVQLNSPAEAILPQRYPDIRLETFASVDEGVRNVAAKDIIAFVNTVPVLVYSIQRQGLNNVKLAGSLDDSVHFSMLLNPRNETLVPILNKAIDAISAKERHDILDRWVKVKYEKGIDYNLILKISAVLGMILLLVLYRNRYVQKMNRKLESIHKKLEEQMHKEVKKNRQQELFMLQQNRLAQMGEMLSMIAHQWRQPLNTLTLINQMLVLKYKMHKLDDDAIEAFDKKSKTLVQQMSQTIDDFKRFFRPDKEQSRFSLNQAIEHVIPIIDPVLEDHGITLEFKAASEIESTGFPNEFGQAIINIINNAKDALVEKTQQEKKIVVTLSKSDNEIRLQLCDNGGGIAPDILPKIFDPYFSTKNEKNGTGLGLYMCRIIIEEHMKGKLSAYNNQEGACFVITLPPNQ